MLEKTKVSPNRDSRSLLIAFCHIQLIIPNESYEESLGTQFGKEVKKLQRKNEKPVLGIF